MKKQVNGSLIPLQSQWKSKYVELRFGNFEYEDDLSSSMNWSTTGENNTNNTKKTIHLFADSCQCRAFKIRGPHEKCSFEISIYGGQRRVWVAPSESERDAWVNSIKNAMNGCLGDVLKESNRDGQDNINNNSVVKLSLISDGPAAPFALDIAKYVTIQSIIHAVSTKTAYRNILQKMSENEVDVAIPVFYVKCHAKESNFSMSLQDVLTGDAVTSVQTTQIWKDLQRDSIRINKELVKGEHGAEGMVGALMRYIMDNVELIRSISTDGKSVGNKVYSRFDITDAQALACARDLLILSNRTQSGGDTYYCVTSLLCDRDKDVCIVTPLACEADPMEISVDIVEEWSAQDKNNNLINDSIRCTTSKSSGDSNSGEGYTTTSSNKDKDNLVPRISSVSSVDDSSLSITSNSNSKHVTTGTGTSSLKSFEELPIENRHRPMSLPPKFEPGAYLSNSSNCDAIGIGAGAIEVLEDDELFDEDEGLNNVLDLPDTTSIMMNRFFGSDSKSSNPNETPSPSDANNYSSSTSSATTRLTSPPISSSSSSAATASNKVQKKLFPNVQQEKEKDKRVGVPTVTKNSGTKTGVTKSSSKSKLHASQLATEATRSSHSNSNSNAHTQAHAHVGTVGSRQSHLPVHATPPDNDYTHAHNDNLVMMMPPATQSQSLSSLLPPHQQRAGIIYQGNEGGGDDNYSVISDLTAETWKTQNNYNNFHQHDSRSSAVPFTVDYAYRDVHVTDRALTSGYAADLKANSLDNYDTLVDVKDSPGMVGTIGEHSSSGHGRRNSAPALESQGIGEGQPHSSTRPAPGGYGILKSIQKTFTPRRTDLQISKPGSESSGIISSDSSSYASSSMNKSPNGSGRDKSDESQSQGSSESRTKRAASRSRLGLGGGDVPVNLCIRIEVQVTSKYRVCDSNPQDEVTSTWSEISGHFHQVFFIKSGCNGRPVVSDRMVNICVDKVSNF